MKERRRLPRKPAKLPVRFRIVREGAEMLMSEPVEAKIRDITLDGLAIETPAIEVDGLHISYNEHPAQKNKVYLHWELPSGRGVKAAGITIWYERASTRETVFVVGLKYLEMSPEDQCALKEFLDAYSGGRPLSF
jgi:hypothetical protein